MSYTAKYKTPGMLKSRIQISSSKLHMSLRGNVYPFENDFHSVSFSVDVQHPTKDRVSVMGIGHGGCSFTGSKAVMIAKATQEALFEAQRLSAIVDEFIAEPTVAAKTITKLLDENEVDEANKSLCLTPDIISNSLEKSSINKNIDPSKSGANIFEFIVRSDGFEKIIHALEAEIQNVDNDGDDFEPEVDFAFSLIEKAGRGSLPGNDFEERLTALINIFTIVRGGKNLADAIKQVK
ncbi:hypothetical protein J8A87_27230 [Vibrio parahaemolyticus]|uniref:Uncharacterized protein n=1 Tax=Vibrio vulnificus TaxID=672 RepID=A0AAN1UF63_VIBVL|nr:hypothetical protein [Vibrio vulnificus]AXX63023.1 hypothetical protein FORC53_4684 [Vibrio vulnificus]EGR5855705.1 hypothetical protein [Vibrio parahaemolyticus]ELA8201055.1 hypothetical protein [Vibrio parahaemolyticus]MCF9168123.1 hypothetical protein [Vibrio parahaemolyticus]